MCGIYPIFVTYCNDLILITYKTVQFATKLLFLPILPTRCGGLEGQVCQLFFYISRCPAPLRGAACCLGVDTLVFKIRAFCLTAFSHSFSSFFLAPGRPTPLCGVGRPGRYNQMAVVCAAHNGGRSCVPYLPHQPTTAPRPKDDCGAAALCVIKCGQRIFLLFLFLYFIVFLRKFFRPNALLLFA